MIGVGRPARRALILFGAMLGICTPLPATAHPLAPALLELQEETAGIVEVLWKRSALSVPGNELRPILPAACPVVSSPRADRTGGAVLLRWKIDCGNRGLTGLTLRVDGMGPTKIDTLVRIKLLDGRTIRRVLRRSESSMVIPEKADPSAVLSDYLTIGFEHILSGADHLLFVFGLYMICANRRTLIKTITAFTVGHSITLSLAALGYSNVPSGPIEVFIALSVLALAVELARDPSKPTLIRRHPWPIAAGFGLLHGMGFAGALREVGLPAGEIPMALFSFNLGIEMGQLAFVFAIALLAAMARKFAVPLPRRTAVYVMGSLAAYWVIERSANIL